MLAPFFSNPAFKCVSRIICISDRRLRRPRGGIGESI